MFRNLSESQRAFRREHPDLGQRIDMVAYTGAIQGCFVFPTVYVIIVTAPDIFAALGGPDPTARTWGDRLWLAVLGHAIVTAALAAPVVAATRNPYNSQFRDAFGVGFVALCIAIPVNVALTAAHPLRLWMDTFMLAMVVGCAVCLFAERGYVNQIEAQIDRELEELGYDEY